MFLYKKEEIQERMVENDDIPYLDNKWCLM